MIFKWGRNTANVEIQKTSNFKKEIVAIFSLSYSKSGINIENVRANFIRGTASTLLNESSGGFQDGSGVGGSFPHLLPEPNWK